MSRLAAVFHYRERIRGAGWIAKECGNVLNDSST